MRSHSVAAAGGINAAVGRGRHLGAHACDTVKGSDYLGDQDAVEVLCREAPEEIARLERLGVAFHRNDGRPAGTRPFGAASQTARATSPTSRARRCCTCSTSSCSSTRSGRPLRGVVRHAAADRRRRRLHGLRRARRAQRRAARDPGEERDPGDRRRGPVLQADDQRGDLHGRRDRARLPGRRRADGHGDGPVPPDDARGGRHPDHRGRARRGRAPLNAQGERFMERYAPNKLELASRDVVSRAEQTEINEGRGFPEARSRSTSPRCRASARWRRCARSSTSGATSRAWTSRASRSTSAPACTT